MTDLLFSDDPNQDAKYEMQPTNIEQNWPDDATVIVCLTFDTQGAIDGLREGSQTGTWSGGEPNWWDYTERQYGISRGLLRILRILDEHDVTATFPIPGMTAEWYPEAIKEITRRGHEIANHTYSHRLLFQLDPAEERAEVEKSTEVIEEITGVRPTGWRSPVYSTSTRTLDLISEHGYTWDSSFHNHDLPYYIVNEDTRILELPAGLDDWPLFLMATRSGHGMGGYPRGTPHGVLDVLTSEFDQLYKEARTYDEPRIFMYTMHPKITGRPHRSVTLEKLIEHIDDKKGTFFATCGEIVDLVEG